MLDLLDQLEMEMEERSLQRGVAYYDEGRVLGLEEYQKHGWVAHVQGSRRTPYLTRIWFDEAVDGSLVVDETDCSCPVGSYCKHVAAVAYAIEGKHAAASRRASATLPEISGPDWLAGLEQALAGPTAVVRDIADHGRMAWHIAPMTGGTVGGLLQGLRFTLGKTQRRADGAYRAIVPIAGADWAQLPRGTAANREVDSLLRIAYPPRYAWSDGSEHGAHRVLDGEYLVPLVQAMVRSGGCFWRDSLVPLRWGPERSAALAWRADDDGYQQLALDLPADVFIVGAGPSLYIAPRDGVVGRLQTAVPSTILGALGNAPRLSMDEAEAFAQQITPVLRPHIPAPSQRVRRDADFAAVPCLRLRLETHPEVMQGHQLSLLAELEFVYGPKRISAADTRDPVWHAEGDAMLRIARQRDVELAAAVQLSAAACLDERTGTYLLGPAATIQQRFETLQTRVEPLRQAGWQIAGFENVQRIIDVDAPVDVQATGSGESPWFSMDMGIEVDGERVSLAPLIARVLQQSNSGLSLDQLEELGPRIYLPLDDQRVVAMPTERLQGLLGVLQELYSGSQLGLGHAVALTTLLDTGHIQMRGDAFVFELARRLKSCEAGVHVEPSSQLRATLRPYQKHGLSWLGFLRAHQLGGVLADDMGLGKTLQTLAHLQRIKDCGELDGAALVVMPTSLLFNWRAECARFTPTMRVATYHGSERDTDWFDHADIVLTSYGVLLRDADLLAEYPFDTIILDESHAIKNPRSKVHHAARQLQGKHRVCLSGTPLQNNLEELWAQFAFVMPGLLDDHTRFNELFRRAIERHNDPSRRAQLAARIRPFLLRRDKAEVAGELPAKTEIIERITLAGAQRDLYETVRNAMDERVRREIHARGIERSSIVVLDALLKLRQVCCDPRLVKLDKARRVKKSAKLNRLLDLVDELLAEGRRMLIFSQFTTMLDLIAQELTKRQVRFVTLTGETVDREAVVCAFQNGDMPVFLLSLKAGGVGLNLTAADTVIHYDPWWNPAAENQATDRAHRIGQDKPVFIYKMIVAGSVEEKILQLQERKRGLTDRFMEQGSMSSQLTQSDLDGIFGSADSLAESME